MAPGPGRGLANMSTCVDMAIADQADITLAPEPEQPGRQTQPQLGSLARPGTPVWKLRQARHTRVKMTRQGPLNQRLADTLPAIPGLYTAV